MNEFFRQQLAVYAEYHRDARNCATHYLGIPMLLLAALLPLALWTPVLFGVAMSGAAVMVAPAVIGWMLLDVGIGLVMLGAIVPMVLVAGAVAHHLGTAAVWSMTAALTLAGGALQVVGHAVYEKRQPALADNLFQMLIGPMFVTAKLVVGLGWRSDLAIVLTPRPARDLASILDEVPHSP